jgi:hypothetical protein
MTTRRIAGPSQKIAALQIPNLVIQKRAIQKIENRFVAEMIAIARPNNKKLQTTQAAGSQPRHWPRQSESRPAQAPEV